MKRSWWVAAAIPCALLGGVASCEPRQATECRGTGIRINRPAGCEGTARCPTLDPRDHHWYGGAEIVITGCVEEALDWVTLDVSWPITVGSRHIFEWAGWVPQGDVFPLHGAVVRHLGCFHGHPPAFPGPGAEIDLSPEGVGWAAPAAGNVFLTLGVGDVLLDHDLRVQARLEQSLEDSAQRTLTVAVTRLEPQGQGQWYAPLYVGDAFPWGDLRATIVRIIGQGDSLMGWVEVSLSEGR